jgi:phosphoserine phosphatase
LVFLAADGYGYTLWICLAARIQQTHLRTPTGDIVIIVSDLIGTLTTGSPVLGLVSWVRHHQSKFRANLYMASIMPGYGLAKTGLINYQKWAMGTMISCLPLLKNCTPEMVAEMAEWAVEKQLWPKRREDILERLRQEAENGAQVTIASSVCSPIVEAFARRIGVHAIGTPVEIQKGQLRLQQPLAVSKQKLERVLQTLGVSELDMAFGDTWQDIPMLERAKKPVAVYPDAILKETAVQHGWEIMGEN